MTKQFTRTSRSAKVIAGLSALAVGVVPFVGLQASQASPAPVTDTGWARPFSGTERYVKFAPTVATKSTQINQPLGQERADALAARFGFDKADAMSSEQYRLLVTGRGVGGGTKEALVAAKLINVSVRYLTNTKATNFYRMINGEKERILLGSYGLIVNGDGVLESPANDTSPVRQINWVLAPQIVCAYSADQVPAGIPCGYMGKWFRANGAKDTLRALYASAYTLEAVYGAKSQGASEPWELVQNVKADGTTSTVGMAMVPSIWIVNFLLIYALNPKAAANMPAYWAPLPTAVADALYASESGQIPYADYMQYFN